MTQYNKRNKDAKVRKLAQQHEIDVVDFQHAWRFNGFVDLYKKMKTVRDLNSGEYYSFDTPEDGVMFAIELAANSLEEALFMIESKSQVYKDFSRKTDLHIS